jgi:hypothetical protein
LIQTPTTNPLDAYFHYPRSNRVEATTKEKHPSNELEATYPLLQSLYHLVEQAVHVEGREPTANLIHSIVAAHYMDTLHRLVQHATHQINVCYKSFQHTPGTEDQHPRTGFHIFEHCVETLRGWQPPVLMKKASAMDRKGVYRLMEVFETDSQIMQSIYVDQLRRWLEHYPSNQVILWDSTDFEQEPEAHLNQMIEALGLSTDAWSMFSLSSNSTNSEPILESIPPNDSGTGFINHRVLYDEKGKMKRHNDRDYIVDISLSIKKNLVDFFKPFNQDLYTLLKQHGHSEFADRISSRYDLI